MTRKLLALAAIAVTFSAPAFAQTRARTYWPPGLEQQEREVTRQLNNEQNGQPTTYYAPQPQYSYAPPPRPYQPYPPQYSYSPPPAYAYPYDYPPRPYYSRYY